MKKRQQHNHQLETALRHENHARPVTRRDFLAQGLIHGLGIVTAPSLLTLLASSNNAYAAQCAAAATSGASDVTPPIPFLCFDLAGGANIAGSNVMVGAADSSGSLLNNQTNALDAAGYTKLGIADGVQPSDGSNLDTRLGLAFHKDSALLGGILDVVSATTLQNVEGVVFCVRSNDDTQNNPHNPMYGIASANNGVGGELINLIGTSSSISGGNSVAPSYQIKAKYRPTKINSEKDVTGLVDIGATSKNLGPLSVNVMQAAEEIGIARSGVLNENDAVQTALNCSYSGATGKIAQFADLNLNPAEDITIQGILGKVVPNQTGTSIVTTDNEFLRTASVMKLLLDAPPNSSTGLRFASAGTVQLGGFDYHTGNRTVGDGRDRKAGQAIGAALEYAAIKGQKLVIYVFSDGAVSSSGKIDEANQRPVWTSDNGTCGATFMLVYNPNGRPGLVNTDKRQFGYYKTNGSVDTGAARFSNNVQALTETVILNYMALSGNVGEFQNRLSGNSFSGTNSLDPYIAFRPI